MKRKRNFVISWILIILAGIFAHYAWMNYSQQFSVLAIVLAALFFMAGVIIFALNFRE